MSQYIRGLPNLQQAGWTNATTNMAGALAQGAVKGYEQQKQNNQQLELAAKLADMYDKQNKPKNMDELNSGLQNIEKYQQEYSGLDNAIKALQNKYEQDKLTNNNVGMQTAHLEAEAARNKQAELHKQANAERIKLASLLGVAGEYGDNNAVNKYQNDVKYLTNNGYSPDAAAQLLASKGINPPTAKKDWSAFDADAQEHLKQQQQSYFNPHREAATFARQNNIPVAVALQTMLQEADMKRQTEQKQKQSNYNSSLAGFGNLGAVIAGAVNAGYSLKDAVDIASTLKEKNANPDEWTMQNVYGTPVLLNKRTGEIVYGQKQAQQFKPNSGRQSGNRNDELYADTENSDSDSDNGGSVPAGFEYDANLNPFGNLSKYSLR